MAVREITDDQRKRYKELDKDFLELFKQSKEEGLFEPNLFHVFLRCIEVPIIAAIGAYIFFMHTTISEILGCALLALSVGRSGWVLHEGGHNSLTGIPKLDKIILKVYMGKKNSL